MSVSMVKIADQSTGATRQYQSLNRMADENSASRIKSKDKNGNEAIFTKIKTAEGKFMYVLCNEGEEIKPSKNAKATDALIAPEGPDKKGNLTTGEKAKSFFKGLISPFTNLFSNPWVTGGVILGAVAIGVACIAFPPFAAAVAAATPVIAKVGLAVGAAQVGYGAYQAGTATNDKDAKKGWENMGAGVFTIGTSAVSLMQSAKAANAATQAANAYVGASDDIANAGNAVISSADDIAGATAGTTQKVSDAMVGISGVTQDAYKVTATSKFVINPLKNAGDSIIHTKSLANYNAAINGAHSSASALARPDALNILKNGHDTFNTLLKSGDIAGATKLMKDYQQAAQLLNGTANASQNATKVLSSMEAAIGAAKAGALNPASKAAILTTGVGVVGQAEAVNDDIERVYKEVGNVHVLAN